MAENTVNIHFAKTHLSRLIEQVSAGESVVIANAGRPVARLVPYEAPSRPVAPPGSLVGRGFSVGPDFDAPLEVLYDVFEEGQMPRRRVAESPALAATEPVRRDGGADPADDARAQADGA
jgi:prevent-host-death family protein